jgi:hypothetical protein
MAVAKREVAVCDMFIVTELCRMQVFVPPARPVQDYDKSQICACGVGIYVARYSEVWLLFRSSSVDFNLKKTIAP